LYTIFSFPLCAICPADFVLPDLIIVISFGEQYKSVERFVMQFSPATFYFICRRFQMPSWTPCSPAASICVLSSVWKTTFSNSCYETLNNLMTLAWTTYIVLLWQYAMSSGHIRKTSASLPCNYSCSVRTAS
jgi:hypothetical protein